jgi:4-amino-4-deoxy-L-arabinose transferase-like glycosyltransferase
MPTNPRTYHPGADEEYYIRFGMDVAQGSFGMTNDFLFMDPLYGYILGIFFTIFGKNLFVIYIFQILLDTLTVGLIYLIGKELVDRQTGLIAALLYGVTATAIFYSTTILKPTSVAFFVTLWVYISIILWRSNTKLGWLYYGLLLGLGVALRSNLFLIAITGILLVPIGNHLHTLNNKKRLAKNSFLAFLGMTLVLIILSWRNETITGNWKFLPPNGGVVLHQTYNKENPQSIHSAPDFVSALRPSRILLDYTTEAERRLGRTLNPYEMSSYWQTEAINYISTHKTQSLNNILRKLLEFTTFKEIANNRAINEGENFSKILSILPRPFGWLLALGIPGLILLAGRTSKGWLAITILLTTVVTFAFFYAISRLRFPATPILAVGSAVTIKSLYYWRITLRKELMIAIVGVSLLGGLSYWSSTKLSEPPQASFMIGLSWGYMKMGDLQTADTLSKKLLKQGQNNYQVYDLAAFIALQKGNLDETITFYKKALNIKPNEHSLLMNYANALQRSGQLENALIYINRAIEIKALPYYYQRKAIILNKIGQTKEAQKLIEKYGSP